MKKIVYSAAAALLLTLSVPLTQAAAKTSADFTDLKDLDAATKAKFDAMINAGVFSGVGETKFGLNDAMNRAQFAKVLALILKLDVNTDLKSSTFTDVKANDPANGYALPYIEALKKSGITQGYDSPNTYNPSGKVSKEELAAFLVRSLGLTIKPDNNHSDVGKVSDWASEYVAKALEYKILPPQQNSDWQASANRSNLVLSSYETKTQFDPLKLVAAAVTDQHELVLSFSASLKESQVDLSKILIGGKPLDSSKAHFKLSSDGKILTIVFDEPLSAELLNQPAISISGIQSITGNQLKTDNPVPIEKANLLPAAPVTPPTSYNPPSNGGYTPPADTTAPQLLSAKRQGSENKVVLSFSEALNGTLAVQKANYKLQAKDESDVVSFLDLPEGTAVQLSDDKKQVTITFPEIFAYNDVEYSVLSYFTGNVGIQVSGLKDLAGNEISPINKLVEAVNPGLSSTVDFFKPDNINDNYNKTKANFAATENHKYRYVLSEESVPVVIGLPFGTGINGDFWEGAELLSPGSLIPIDGSNPTITVIDYNQATGVVYGYKSFAISEDQVLRPPTNSGTLSQQITFHEGLLGTWTASFNSLDTGHSYYYRVSDTPITILFPYKELDELWAHANALTTSSTILAVPGQYVTVIEVKPKSEVSDQIIAAHSFQLTSTNSNLTIGE
ncbi:S-layer homology domain-containing protein [Paenibacillus zeisoli]|uniref:S-layer homology domain-containing protein n=1 Tax=Paenibacillus zeisoli TaxID=2496267 RepID=A0A433XNH8_9BACL|nr:S-layer homology domain-containing protein [Paenibacillus zeisoli]RUT35604.1 S-layer homology domain-containing protein [Paenibacillus zeisoli]